MNRKDYLGHLLTARGRLEVVEQAKLDSELSTPHDYARRVQDDYEAFAAMGRVMSAGRAWVEARAHGTPEQLADANAALQRALAGFGIDGA